MRMRKVRSSGGLRQIDSSRVVCGNCGFKFCGLDTRNILKSLLDVPINVQCRKDFRCPECNALLDIHLRTAFFRTTIYLEMSCHGIKE